MVSIMRRMHTRQAKPPYWILFVLPLLWGLSACAADPIPVSTPSPAAVTAVSTIPTATPASPPAPQTPLPPACLSRPGRLLVVTLDSAAIPRFHLYLPPCYETDLTRRYPVLYLFHGATYDDSQWPRLGAAAAADQLIAPGRAAPFIIIMPYDRASWREPQDDQFDQAVLSDLIPYVDSRYRTLAGRQHRALGGLSRGAGWALRLGLTHPGLFGALGAHSPVVFYVDRSDLPVWVAGLPAGTPPDIYLDIGRSDREHGAARQLADLLDKHQVPHVWLVHNGSHDEDYWQAHIGDYLQWYASHWGNP